MQSWRAILVLPLTLLLAGCPREDLGDPQVRDPEGVLGDVALAAGDRVCETPAHGELLVMGVVLAHADANMHPVGECINPVRPLYVHEQQIDDAPEEQNLFVRVGDDRYLRVVPRGGAGAADGAAPRE
jgi:hypothetical protein